VFRAADLAEMTRLGVPAQKVVMDKQKQMAGNMLADVNKREQ